MSNDEFDLDNATAFTPDERNRLLMDAVQRLNALGNYQSSGGATREETSETKVIRTLAGDEATFAGTPIVRRISDREFLTRELPVPVNLREMFGKYRFYFLEFPFEIDPAAGWGFNYLEAKVAFNPDDDLAIEQPKVFQIFPDPKFQQFFQANANLEVGVKANGEFAAKTGTIDVQAGAAAFKVGAEAGAKAGGEAGFIIGPFSFSVKRAVINHRGTGKEWARWEIAGTQLNKGDDPRLMLIIQVPKQTTRVGIRGELLAKRYFTLANDGLKEAVKDLPEALRRFFFGGTPYYHKPNDWDLTGMMELG